MVDINKLLAKKDPDKPLMQHLEETGIIMEVLLTSSIYRCVVEWVSKCFDFTKQETIRLLCYLASIHDIGKAHKLFINALNTGKSLGFRHERESKEYLEEYLKENTALAPAMRRFFGDLIALHHQKYRSNSDFIVTLNEKEEIRQSEEEINRYFVKKYHPKFPAAVKYCDSVGYVISGLLIFADWIASTVGLINQADVAGSTLSFLEEAYITPSATHECKNISDMWENIKVPSPMQQELMDYIASGREMPALTIIEDVPGSGKTEAALFLAEWLAKAFGKSGFYMALPTATTASAMNERCNELLCRQGENDSRLICGDAWIRTPDFSTTQTDADRWFSPTRLGMIQKNTVGTVDQAMLAVMKNKFACLRMLGLTSKVLIIDEVHAYDAYMQGILSVLLTFCRSCHIPVVLLSATLPSRKKRQLISGYLSPKKLKQIQFKNNYPLLTMVFQDKKADILQKVVSSSIQQTYNMHMLNSREEAIDLLIKSVKDNNWCAIYFADTVKSSQYVFQKIKDKVNDEDIFVILLHAGFTMARRAELEEKCIELFGKNRANRPKRAILVSTQVGELSLNIDGDLVVSEPAGMDILIQRIGREWRHPDAARKAKHGSPDVYIIDDEKLCEYVYNKDEVLIRNTLDYCKQNNSITFPTDIRQAIEAVDPGDESKDVMIQTDDGFVGRSSALPVQKAPMKGVDTSELFLPSALSSFYGTSEDKITRSTRLGNSSVAIAIIPLDMFNNAKRYADSGKKIPRKLVKEIYSYKCNRPFKEWMAQYIHEDWIGVDDMVLLPVNAIFGPTETAEFKENGICVRMDKDLGITMRKD